MSQALSATPSPALGIPGGGSNLSKDLVQKFGRGLRVLIRRACPEHSEECFSAVIDATLSALESGEIQHDTHLPAFMQKTYRRIGASYDRKADPVDSEAKYFSAEEIVELKARLSIFKPNEREALYRFYVLRQHPLFILRELGLDRNQFDSIRKIGSAIVEFSLREQSRPHQQATVLVSRRDLGEANCG